jgi:hypothetical protein
LAIYGLVLQSEEDALIIKKQFDVSQQAVYQSIKKDGATPLLSPEDEQELAATYIYLEEEQHADSKTETHHQEDRAALSPVEHMTDISKEDLRAKLESQTQGILDVYSHTVACQSPSNFCDSLQELLATVEKVVSSLSLISSKATTRSYRVSL